MVFASRGRVLSYANQHVVVDLGVGRILLPLSVARDPAKHHSILLESEAFAAAHPKPKLKAVLSVLLNY